MTAICTLDTWRDNVAGYKASRGKGFKAINRWANQCLVRCISAWGLHTREKRRKCIVMRKVLIRMKQQETMLAFDTWASNVAELQHNLIRMSKILLRMRNLLLASTLQTWLDNSNSQRSERLEEQRKRSLMQHAVSRVLHRSLSLALLQWAENSQQQMRLRKLASARNTRILCEAICAWEAWIAVENILRARQCRITARIRHHALTSWELQAYTLRVAARRHVRAIEMSVCLLRKQLAASFSLWQNLSQVLSAARSAADRRMNKFERALCAGCIECWVTLVLWAIRKVEVRSRIVRRWGYSGLFPGSPSHALLAWRQTALCRKMLRYHLTKGVAMHLRNIRKRCLLSWSEYADTKARLSRIHLRVRKSAQKLRLHDILWQWKKAAQEYAARDRWRARISLTEPRMGFCAPRRADRAWQRALLGDWLHLSASARGRGRLQSALVARWIYRSVRRSWGAWQQCWLVGDGVCRLRRRVLWRQSMCTVAVALTGWRDHYEWKVWIRRRENRIHHGHEARRLRHAFMAWGLEWGKVEARCRVEAVSSTRHASFVQHDVLHNWLLRKQQSVRYWASVERRVMRYMSFVMEEWLAAAGHQHLRILKHFRASALQKRRERDLKRCCVFAWRRWVRVICQAFYKSTLILYTTIQNAFWKWALSVPKPDTQQCINCFAVTHRCNDVLVTVLTIYITSAHDSSGQVCLMTRSTIMWLGCSKWHPIHNQADNCCAKSCKNAQHSACLLTKTEKCFEYSSLHEDAHLFLCMWQSAM